MIAYDSFMGVLFWVGMKTYQIFCFARFAREKESTVLNRKNLVGLAFAHFWAGVWAQGPISRRDWMRL
jgi:hypothetical protein